MQESDIKLKDNDVYINGENAIVENDMLVRGELKVGYRLSCDVLNVGGLNVESWFEKLDQFRKTIEKVFTEEGERVHQQLGGNLMIGGDLKLKDKDIGQLIFTLEHEINKLVNELGSIRKIIDSVFKSYDNQIHQQINGDLQIGGDLIVSDKDIGQWLHTLESRLAKIEEQVNNT